MGDFFNDHADFFQCVTDAWIMRASNGQVRPGGHATESGWLYLVVVVGVGPSLLSVAIVAISSSPLSSSFVSILVVAAAAAAIVHVVVAVVVVITSS